MSDFKFIKGEREYLEFEEVIRFEYKGKVYERVLYSSDVRDGMNSLYMRDEDGNEVESLGKDENGLDIEVGDVEDWLSEVYDDVKIEDNI